MSRLLLLSPLAALFAFALLPTGEARPPLPKDNAPKSVTNSAGMKFVLVPKGKFTMGSAKEEQDAAIAEYAKTTGGKAHDAVVAVFRAEGPPHEVRITRPYYLGTHEVTQGQFREVMGYNPSHFSTDGTERKGTKYFGDAKPAGGKDKVKGLAKAERDALPVECVSWGEAVEFCKKLSATKKEKEAKRAYRLPSEAEWEYACRAGTDTAFHAGKSLSVEQANFGHDTEEGKGSLGRTAKVGSYKPNAWGLYDMHGNVLEWCSDWYGAKYYADSPKDDPVGPKEGARRAMRGGGWGNPSRSCRSAYRAMGFPPGAAGSSIGFRVVLEAPGKKD